MMNFFAPRGEGLVVAAWQGNIETVRTLIAGGADVNQLDLDEASALMNAIGSKVATDSTKLEIVKQLVEAGCDVNYRDFEDDSAMALAATEGVPEIVEYLIEHGANPNITAFRMESILDLAESAFFDERHQAESGLCPEEAPVHQQTADAIARSIAILKKNGAVSFERLRALKVGKWIRITPFSSTGLLTDTGFLTLAQVSGMTQELADQFQHWFEGVKATRTGPDGEILAPGFDNNIHNELGWKVAEAIKRLVGPSVEVVLMLLTERGTWNSSTFQKIDDTPGPRQSAD